MKTSATSLLTCRLPRRVAASLLAGGLMFLTGNLNATATDVAQQPEAKVPPDPAMNLYNMGNMCNEKGNYVKAAEYLQQALVLREKELGPEHLDVAMILNNLGNVFDSRGDFPKAAEYHQRALAIREKALGPDHPDVAASLSNLGLVYQEQKENAKAAEFYQRALVITEKALGPDDPSVAMILTNLGNMFNSLGEFLKAAECHQRALVIRKKWLGPTHPDVAASLNNLGNVFDKQRDYAKAVDYLQQALTIREKALGPDHLDIATSLYNLGNVYCEQGNYAKSAECYLRALNIKERKLGPDHFEVVIILNNLGNVFEREGEYAKAANYIQRSLAIREKLLGENHPDLAASMNNLGNVFGRQGNYAKAVECYKRALTIEEKAQGPDYPDMAVFLNNLGNVFDVQGEYAKAVECYQRALTIREKAMGPNHPDVATILNNLGNVFGRQWDNAKATKYYQRALAIEEKAMGPDHPDVATILNNLGNVFDNQGEYAKAGEHYQRALAITEKAKGPDHPDVATILNGLGNMFGHQGDFAKAAECHQRALAIREKALGPDHSAVALSLDNLGLVSFSQKDYAKAAECHQRALAIEIKSLGPNHPDVARSLNNLGLVCFLQGDYAKAADYHQCALAIWEKTFGPDHPDVARSLYNLGNVYFLQGDCAKAVEYYQRVLTIWEKTLGAEHHQTGSVHCNLAFAFLANNDMDNALLHATNSADIAVQYISRSFAAMSSRQRDLLETANRPNLDVMLTLAVSSNRTTVAAKKQSALWLLRTKGLAQSSLSEQHHFLRIVPEAQPVMITLQVAKSELAGLAMRNDQGRSDDQKNHDQERVKALDARVDELEQTLAKMAAPIRDQRRTAAVRVSDVQSVLSAREALIEFVRFSPIATAEQRRELAAGGNTNVWAMPAEYAAIVFRHDTNCPVVVARVGKADAIDNLVHRSQAAMRNGKNTAELLAEAYASVWVPLAIHLQNVRRVIVSPDGELNFLPFAALITPENKYLCEKYEVGYVASGRDLLTRLDKPATNRPVLFGDPVFGDAAKDGDYLDRGVAFRSAFTDPDRAMLDGMRFPPLPGTRKEVEGLMHVLEGKKLPSAVYLGQDATKRQLMTLKSPGMLHLATHGFFLPDVKESPQDALQMMTAGKRGVVMGMPVHIENPMLRSGLAFTGAALSLTRKGEMAADKDDGIVTAEEVGSLDLWGTKLVVLSACDTGMGEAKAGQGVMGLRCAFTQAGARNLMMTLWPVQDETTGQLMVQFYRKYLENGDAIGAINAVQRDSISAARKKGEPPNPRVWAPFLVSVQGKAKRDE